MIVLKQNLLALAVATVISAVPLATLQADDLPPAPPGPYAVDGAQEIPAAAEVVTAPAETGAAPEAPVAETEATPEAPAVETEVAAAPTEAQQAPAVPQAQAQGMAQRPMMYGYPQYYQPRPQVQYIYVVPMMMPKMSEAQKKQMQQQMMQMYGGGQQMQMIQQQPATTAGQKDEKADDVEQQEANSDS